MTAWDVLERPRIRSPARLKYDQARQTDILLLPERVVLLNTAAGAILRLCDGNHTVDQIIRKLEEQYQQSGLKEDVLEFLQDAAEKGWVESWKQASLSP
jgi:pyrroloquinoline quinone biosynthesis protein D